MSYREPMVALVERLQDEICDALASIDGTKEFGADRWDRPGGGGGLARVLEGGRVFEKAGVNSSVVHGELPERIANHLGVEAAKFFATGLSLVIHPVSPHVPTVHANVRYFETGERDAWFGGGIDLTPYTDDERSPRHFHATLKAACDRIDVERYPVYKQQCDEYFWIGHRREARGIGGVFYDYLRGDENLMAQHFSLQTAVGEAFLPAYLPIVEENLDKPWTERERQFQLLRRGRYVEFNLVYDRGTKFGLETDGRIESILMSLPATATWAYDADMEQTPSERRLMSWLRKPIEWI